ncbi:MAG: pyruvate ferredoxin oxidoreductase [Bacillota bacterium]|jgi:pyruvate ferredoxin oxidoreductase alpha subunit|nr:MAG: pyruvate ferredoxin oxidoreductase [Bacillota bacterium]
MAQTETKAGRFTARGPKGRPAGRVALTGNEAVALAMRQIEPDVVAAYPITPQTDIVQYFSSFVADGRVATEFVTVESEHSAMSATVGAAAAGARAMTATSANGLALMWEVLYIAAGSRLPIVMPVVNRALSAPINIHCDHSDAMGARDSAWIQLWSEDAQEAYDNVIQAVRIAEHPDVHLPVMVCLDGFIISHALMNLEVLPDEVVKDFVGSYRPDSSLLDPERPITVGPLDLYDFYFEHKRQQAEAMRAAAPVIREVAEDYETVSGRRYGDFDAYRLEDAHTAVVVLGSAAGTARFVVDELRRDGRRVGLLKPRVFRPFPGLELADALAGLDAVAVLDRSDSFSTMGGPLFAETRAALYQRAVGRANRKDSGPSSGSGPGNGRPLPITVNFIYGLGGRDIDPGDMRAVFSRLARVVETGDTGDVVNYLGVRE